MRGARSARDDSLVLVNVFMIFQKTLPLTLRGFIDDRLDQLYNVTNLTSTSKICNIAMTLV